MTQKDMAPASLNTLITEHLDIWTTAIKPKAAAGRGASKKTDIYGVKKLRELILDLAIRGLLVPQDPNDEPASELLKRIATEKEQLVKEGKIKKRKATTAINKNDMNFQLPSGWAKDKLGNLFNLDYGDNLPKNKRTETGEYPVYGSNGIVGTHNCFRIEKACIVIGRKGSAGALQKSKGKCWVTDVAYSVVPPSCLNFDFLFYQFHTLGLDKLGKGIKPGLNRNEAYLITIAIPPAAEQHRIVTKINKLMSLCDQLEQKTQISLAAHQELVDNLLTALVNSADPQQFQAAWQSIVAHFHALFTTDHSIEQLKQTILQLAVMGKLVPQDPSDEPANVLLTKIAAEKQALIKAKKIKKAKPLPKIGEEEKSYSLADTWEWAQLGTIVTIRGGKRVSNGYKLSTIPTDYIYIRVKDMQNGSIDDTDLHYIDSDMREKIKDYIITEEDIYMTIVGATIGKCGLVPRKFNNMNLTENAARLTPHGGLEKRFLHKVLTSNFCQFQFIEKTKQVGVQKMALNRLASTVIPLPPLNEQKRIIAKVDELMALCDRLAASIQNAQGLQIDIADALTQQAASQ